MVFRNVLPGGVRVLGLLALGATASLTGAAETASPQATTAQVKSPSTSDLIIQRTNQERARYGLPALQPSPELGRAAYEHARRMAQSGQFSHYAGGSSPQARASWQGYNGAGVTENIAYQGSGFATADQAAAAFMNQWLVSPGHRNNIFSRQVNQIGVATINMNGRYYAVQMFGHGWNRAPQTSSRPATSNK